RVKSDNNATPANYVRIADCTFRYTKVGIWSAGAVSYNLYEHNQFYDSQIADWPWYAHKVDPNETEAISLTSTNNYTEGSNVVRFNLSDGPANGWGVQTRNTDLHGNIVRHAADDSFEPDTAYGTSN